MSTLNQRRLAVMAAAEPAPVVAARPSLLSRLHGTLAMWHARAQGRRQLAQMSPYMLADIGITPCQAQFEAAKPFWRA